MVGTMNHRPRSRNAVFGSAEHPPTPPRGRRTAPQDGAKDFFSALQGLCATMIEPPSALGSIPAHWAAYRASLAAAIGPRGSALESNHEQWANRPMNS